MKAVKYVFALSFILFLTSNCSEQVEPHPTEYHKIFTGNNKKIWKVTSLQWTGEGKETISYGVNCLRDEAYIFYNNNERSYEVTKGNINCYNDEPSSKISDEWSFVNATATMSIIFPIFSETVPLPFYVKKLTTKEMVLEIYIDQDNKYSYKITMQSVSEE